DVSEMVLAVGQGQLVLVTPDAVPAMGALEGLTNGAMTMMVVQRSVRSDVVHPAGLRDAQIGPALMAAEQVEQRPLNRQRQLARQGAIQPGAPEQQTAGEGQQVQLAGEIRILDGSRQLTEGPKREQILDAASRLSFTPQQRLRPGGQRAFVPGGELGIVLARQDAQACLAQIAQPVVRFLVDGAEPSEQGVWGELLGQLLFRRGRETAPEPA